MEAGHSQYQWLCSKYVPYRDMRIFLEKRNNENQLKLTARAEISAAGVLHKAKRAAGKTSRRNQ